MLKSWRFHAAAAVILGTLALVITGCWISNNQGEPAHVNETTPLEETAPINQMEHSGKVAPSDETASSNGAVRIGAVASASEIAPSNRAEHSDETTPTGETAPPNATEHSGGAAAADEAARPRNMGQAHGFLSPRRHTPAPLRLRIFEATTIVRTTLITSSATTERYWAATGFDVEKDKESAEDWYPVDGGYRAAHSFRFRVSEYLKGSGPSEITVKAVQLGTHGTEAEALQVATDSLAGRDASRDAHEAILFLWEPTTDGALYFLISGPYPSLHYMIDTLNRVWLPAKDPPAPAGASSSSDDSSQMFLMGEPVLGLSWPTTMSLGELRSEVAAVDALLAAGDGTRGDAAIAAMANSVELTVDDFLLQAEIEAEDGIEWYRECVRAGWRYDHTYEHLQDKPRSSYEDVLPLASGAPAGTVIESYSGPGRKLIKGADKNLFKAVLIDDDDRRDNGFEIGDATTRPLPAGTYQYKSYLQLLSETPCDFFPYYSYTYHKVVVTAPAGTTHELFFDPVTLGADATNGQLKPASFFGANGEPATIHRISYDSTAVTMTLSPVTAITGHTLDFIALDGSVSLSLHADDATLEPTNHTLSWPVPDQPWRPGDKLMLRISLANP